MVDENKEFEPQEFGVGDPHSADVGVEPDLPPTQTLFVQLFVMTIVVVIAVIGLIQYVKMDVRAELQAKDLALPSKQLAEVRAREKAALTDYAVADAEKNLYQVPVTTGMLKLVANPDLLVRVPPIGDGGPLWTPPAPQAAAPGAPAAVAAPAR